MLIFLLNMENSSQNKAKNTMEMAERIRFENSWWSSGMIEADYENMHRRFYLNHLYPLIRDLQLRRAVVMMGPRRVGKTVLMHHAISQLIKDGVSPQRIAFLSIDHPVFANQGLESLFQMARQSVGATETAGWYVFFDEIQYLRNWEIHLKTLVDSYPKTKFIVSGSAAAALKFQSAESGAGRFTEFYLPPLSFYEYIHLIAYEHLIRHTALQWSGNIEQFYGSINLREMNQHFLDYINFGGYPELIFAEKMRTNLSRFVKSDIIEKVLMRDLPTLYGIQDVQELNAFFAALAYQSGNEVSLNGLFSASGVEKALIQKYLVYLEAAFLIKRIHRVDDTAKRFQRARFFKTYLSNPSLRSALFAPLSMSDDSWGAMVETAIFSQWAESSQSPLWYARWSTGRFQGEVDMIGLSPGNLKPLWALEIKWSNSYFLKPEKLKSLLLFCKKNGLTSALVSSIDREGTIHYDGIELIFVPAAMLAYSIGAHILNK